MKNKSHTAGRLVSIIGILLFLFVAGAYLVDTRWNGNIVTWFYRNYMDRDTGQLIWSNLKRLVVSSGIFLIIAITLLVWSTAYFHARRKQEQAIEDIGNALRSLVIEDTIPDMTKEYIEIENQLRQIQTNAQRTIHNLEQQTQQKNDLITYLAHDIKTPLTSVIGYLSLVDEASDMPDEQRQKYVKITLDKSYRLESLINEFFEITRYNLHKITLEKTPIDLYYMLLQLTDEFYPILTSQNKQVLIHCAEDVTILGDSDKLARVFNNVLKNAVYYSNENSTIDITVTSDTNYITISFKNNGKTIPQEKLTTIFDKFYRLDESRSSNTGGAGLGLAIAKEIITLHNGEISADSYNGETIFTIKLPIKIEA